MHIFIIILITGVVAKFTTALSLSLFFHRPFAPRTDSLTPTIPRRNSQIESKTTQCEWHCLRLASPFRRAAGNPSTSQRIPSADGLRRLNFFQSLWSCSSSPLILTRNRFFMATLYSTRFLAQSALATRRLLRSKCTRDCSCDRSFPKSEVQEDISSRFLPAPERLVLGLLK